MKFISTTIFCIILILNSNTAEAGVTLPDELTLRNQLFADIFLLKEGVDKLQISVEVLNKRYNNQMETLKSIQTDLFNNNDDSQEEDGICNRITGMFNTTLRKYNVLENRLVTKLDEVQEEQTTRLEEILLKQKLKKNCGYQGTSAGALSVMSETLSEMNEKIEQFEGKFVKLATLKEKLNLQQKSLDDLVEKQLKLLQGINEKLSKNQEQFEKFGNDLTKLKDITNNVNKLVQNPRPKLPMKVILGLTTSNVTTFK